MLHSKCVVGYDRRQSKPFQAKLLTSAKIFSLYVLRRNIVEWLGLIIEIKELAHFVKLEEVIILALL